MESGCYILITQYKLFQFVQLMQSIPPQSDLPKGVAYGCPECSNCLKVNLNPLVETSMKSISKICVLYSTKPLRAKSVLTFWNRSLQGGAQTMQDQILSKRLLSFIQQRRCSAVMNEI